MGKNDIFSSKLSANKINVATTSQWFSSHNKGQIIPNLLASLQIITNPIYIIIIYTISKEIDLSPDGWSISKAQKQWSLYIEIEIMAFITR